MATHFNEIIARDAAAQSRALSRPQNADAYKVELPATFQPPAGVEFKIDANNPLWSQAQAWAHKVGLTQDEFGEGIALIAGDRIATDQKIKTAKNAEIAKLGTAGPARIGALETFYKAHLGDAEAGQLMSRVLTASDVALHEKLIAKFSSQGSASFRTNGREPPPQQGRVSDAEYERMSQAERWSYAKSFDQSQFKTGASGR